MYIGKAKTTRQFQHNVRYERSPATGDWRKHYGGTLFYGDIKRHQPGMKRVLSGFYIDITLTDMTSSTIIAVDVLHEIYY